MSVIDSSSSAAFEDHVSSNVDDLCYVPQSFIIGFEKYSIDGSKEWVPDVDPRYRPDIGMVFHSLSDAFKFYKEYAHIGGFEAVSSSQKGKTVIDGDVCQLPLYKSFECARGGPKVKHPPVNTLIPVTNSNCEVKNYKRRNRTSKKIGCRACIKVLLIEGFKFVLYRFSESHNHPLVHPDYRRHLNSNRDLNFSKKRMLHKMSEAGIGAYPGHRILTKVSGIEDVGFSKTEAKNYKRDVLTYIGKADCQMVVNLLNRKKESLPDFSFDYFVDEEASLGGMFWADECSKRNFNAFGDVVSFDATYRTNKYDMVFIPFTGIDNHKRCVTFGAGMLSKENVISYKWLLSVFKKAFPRAPRLILTDQDPAMKIAIDYAFPLSRHRLCMWHIMEKVSSKVSAVVCNDGFKPKLCRIVWTDKLEPEVFDFLWDSVIEEYGLQDKRWLNDMFDLRKFWIPAYFRSWELSGLMRTSSRSESENHMFNQLMKSSDTLIEFLTHFDTAMYEQRFSQSRNDYECTYTAPNLKYDWGVEKDAASIFTRNVFNDISKEIGLSVKKCMSLNFSDSNGLRKFTIVDTSVLSMEIDETIDRVKDPKYFDEFFPKDSEVVYNVTTEEVFCTCKCYERFGLLCRHIFYVLRLCNVRHFPKKYICSRWTKGVVPPKINVNAMRLINSALDDSSLCELIMLVYLNVERSLDKLIGNKEKLAIFVKSQEQLFEECVADFSDHDRMTNKEFIGEMLGVEQPENIEVYNPVGIRNKGSGLRKRISSSRENSMAKQNNNSRKCSYCGSYDQHNIRTCPARKQKEAADEAGTSQPTIGVE